MDYIVRWLLAAAPAIGCMFAMGGLIHYFQLESYQFPGYFHALSRNWKRALLPGITITLLMLALFLCFDTITQSENPVTMAIQIIIAAGMCVVCALGGLWIAKLVQDRKAKKPLVFTARVKRLYIIMGLLFLGVTALFVYKSPISVLPALLPILLPWIVALGGLIAWPFEKLISEYYFRDARKKLLSMKKLIRIGVTGSYGKTSVKFILDTILSEKYNVLATPSSFNTPMGVARIIREKLQPAHQIFIAEMGARRRGDIKELCRLCRPELGVLTSVGPQHLETFKSLERVIGTKYELIEALPSDGHGFFFDDGDICLDLYNKTQKPKSIASLSNPKADVYAQNILVTQEGTQFKLIYKNQSEDCNTKLLGVHNIQNILLAASVGFYLGLTIEQIKRGISKIKPVEHRLELINNNGLTIIDDAYNSNPKGTAAALSVLREFKGRKIIITPGMVELGSEEAKYNKEFGKDIARSVDIAILIGKKRSEAIAQGIEEAGFPKENLYIVASLDESTKLLHSIMRAGDVILYENDLPDHYSES